MLAAAARSGFRGTQVPPPDARRLAAAGFTVLRFRNEIVLTSPSQVFEAIRAVADKASFSP